jgi:two-component system sensor histidine kinase PilS (NtrC family)
VKIIETVSENAEETLALATLGRLTRGALHEISNPLVALLGSAELALAEAQPGTKLHARLSLTHRTGTEIVEIVRALQAFVRMQAEPPQTLSVGEAAADAVALVSRVLPAHGVELAASGDATVVAAPGELRRRLVELLLSALDDPERGDRVELVVGDGVVTATGAGELRF